MKKATLNDVAKLAGVDKSTASLALNRKKLAERLLPETRERIQAAACALHYRRDLIAASFRGQSFHTIGMVGANFSHAGIQEWQEHVSRCLRAQGYQLYYAIQPETGPTLDTIHELVDHRVDGIILNCYHNLNPEECECPTLSVEQLGSYSELHVDLAYGAFLAGRHLIQEHRQRKIAYVGCSAPLDRPGRETGLAQALAEAGLPADSFLKVNAFHNKDFPEELLAALRSGFRAFLCQNDYLAAKLIHLLQRHKLSVPRDVAVLGVDGHALCDMTAPELATVLQPFRAFAERTATLMLEKIRRKIFTRLPEEVLQPLFLPGESCGCPPRRAADTLYWDGARHTLDALSFFERESSFRPLEVREFSDWRKQLAGAKP